MANAALPPTVPLEPPFLIVKPGVTEEEFYRWANEDANWEYLDGRIVMHSPASYRHQDLEGFLAALLRGYLGERPTGIVLASRYPMRLDERWSPEPDILVVRNEHASRITKNHLDGPADLVIEICSESDPQLDYREKLPRYRDAKVPEIWVVDPFQGHVHAETVGGEPRILKAGRLESAVLPGFWIDVAWLWQEKLPAPLPCLMAILGR